MTSAIDLRCGDWREVLADVGEVDAVITDPPYGARTHDGHDAAASALAAEGKIMRREINYASMSPADVDAMVATWLPRCRGWFAAFTSHDLIPAWEEAYNLAGRYAFAPVPVIQKRLRACGDGPSSWAVYLLVCRPRGAGFHKWATLPGAYDASIDRSGVIGGKPLTLMRAIVGDYTNPGDVVVDPCAGGATTLIAAAELGCTAIGAELDPETYAKAQARIAKGYTPMPHPRAHKVKGKPKQGALW